MLLTSLTLGRNTNTQIGLDPHLQCSPNQINTAQSVGIWGALKLGYTTIASNSACSISQIKKQLYHPYRENQTACNYNAGV